MKYDPIRVVLYAFASAMILLTLSCATGTQNGNQNQNQNQNQKQNESQKSGTVVSYDAACDDDLTLDQKKKNVEDKIKKEFDDHGRLKDDVKYAVKKVGTTHLEILLEGGVRYKDDMDDLIKIVRKFMKSKCATRVLFVAPGTLPLASESERYEGFEWIGCEEPNVVCPNGECKRPENCDMAGNSNAPMPSTSPTP